MKNIISTIVIATACFIFSLVLSGCGTTTSTGTDDTTEETHQYLVIPGAQFFSGTPTAASTAGSAVKPTVTAPASTIYTADTTITWTLEWSAVIDYEVTDIIINVPELNGYFDYMLSEDEITNKQTEIDTYVTWDRPEKTQVCNRDYRGNGTCYEQADTGVTGMDFATANVDAYDPTVEIVDLEINFEAEFTVETVTISEVADDDGGGGGTTGDAVCSEWVAMCSCSMRACSDGSRAWYDVGSGVYYCASISNCTGAATNAVNYCTRGC